VVAALLSAATVLELSVQTTVTSTMRADASNTAPTISLHVGNAGHPGVSWQAVILIYLLALAATFCPA
jgi:hypothetical protein